MPHAIARGAVAAALCLGLAAPAAAQFTMKLSSPTINDVTHEWMKTFKSGVEGRSGGKVKVEIYPASQLGPIPRTVEGVALGTIEFAAPATGFLVGLDPRWQIFDAVGMFDDMRHAQRVLMDAEVRKRLATFGNARGVEPLTTVVHSPLALVSHKAVRTLDDFKGQKIRTPGGAPLHMEPLKKLGASPISMPLGDVLPALQNKAIDGLIAGSTVYTSFKYYDVAKPLTHMPKWVIVTSYIVNRNWMSSLGPELGAIVREEAAKADQASLQYGIDDVERARKVWEQNGGQTITLSPGDAAKFVAEVESVMVPLLAANPAVKAEYDFFMAAAKKHRQ